MVNFFIHLVIGTVLFLGGYRPYFWCQHRTKQRSVAFKRWSTLDHYIPLCPRWIWFYTVFYYPIIVVVVSLAGRDHHQFVQIAFSYMLMLAAMCTTYLLLPIATPPDWRRELIGDSPSERMLRLVRSIDGSNNCFPSGHAAVTIITAYHMASLTGPLVAALWALSIHVSCLLCKQHYLVDLAAGASLGGAIIYLYSHFLI